MNVVLSHEAARERSGALLIGISPALGCDRAWTAANIHDGVRAGPGGSWASRGLAPLRVKDVASVVDLSSKLEPGGPAPLGLAGR